MSYRKFSACRHGSIAFYPKKRFRRHRGKKATQDMVKWLSDYLETPVPISVFDKNGILHCIDETEDTKAKPPSGNIPCATPENPISSAPSIIVSRVQPEIGTCGKAASSILIRTAFALVSFESSEDSLVFSRSRSSNSSSLFCSRSLNSSNPGFTGSLDCQAN
uniref:Uncharacterized protein n=1 Tax=Glossina pallidipes TaxID=7398 RepID=A0A1A9Z7G0_GLOPL